MFGGKKDIAILVVLQIILGAVYLDSVPRTYVDEVWDSSLGYSLASTGSLKHPFVESLGGMNIHYVPPQVVLPFVCAAIFKVVDYSIFTSRIGSLIFSLLAVVSLYAVMRRWFGAKQAFWIVFATIINPWFFEVSRRSRPEIYYTALALVFLWLLLVYFDSNLRRTAFFAGALAGLSFLAHPNGLIITFSIGCALIIWQKGRQLERLIPWVTLGFTATILPYIIYVLWATQNPRISFTEQMQVSTLHTLSLYSEILRWKRFLQLPQGAPLAIIMFASWIAVWYRSSAADKSLATIIVLFALVVPFATVTPYARYLVPTIPFFCALIVRLIWRVMTRGNLIWQNRYKFRFAIGVGAIVIYLSICFTFIGLMFYHLRKADFTKVVNRVASAVGPGSRVYGDPIFWVGHDRYQYGPHIINYEGLFLLDAVEMIRKYNFDYAVRTAWLVSPPRGFANSPRSMPGFRNHSLTDIVCQRFGTKIDEFYDPYYGPIEIYKLDWDKPRKVRFRNYSK
ncbi:MAG: glycosyltransferase family 39 protein [Phycisphaerae bacterium]|jgi:hypothetical protein